MRKAVALSIERKLLLIETLLALALARLLLLIPVSRWLPTLGTLHHTTATSSDPARIEHLRTMRWAIDTVGKRVFWRADCLPQAIAAVFMLKRRRIAYTLYVGVNTQQPAEIQSGAFHMNGHSWVRSGSIYVSGGAGHEVFKVISTFAKDYP